MKLFPCGHATHPQWPMAAGLVLAQLKAQMALPDYASAPTLGLLYITDHYAPVAQEILDHLSAELPEVTDWAGTLGVGVAASGVEYFDEPALSVMLCALPTDQYRVFSGVAPLGTGPGMGFEPHTALLHADANTPDVAELVMELAERTATGYLFGGLASSRSDVLQFAVGGNGNIRGQGAASGVFSGGLSGVAFGEGVALVSRVTQGCLPVAPVREVTAADGNLVLTLDGEPALDVMLSDLGVSLDEPRAAMAKVRATLVGLTHPADLARSEMVSRTGNFGTDTRVRHIIGLDPGRNAAWPWPSGHGAWRAAGFLPAQRAGSPGRPDAHLRRNPRRAGAGRNAAAGGGRAGPARAAGNAGHPARASRGAIYVSCAGRGGPHFGGPSAELKIVQHARWATCPWSAFLPAARSPATTCTATPAC
jgi:small ligand-binding sensory domain FIST